MAYAITSEDFLAICLVIANGDTGLSTEKIIQRAETYQEFTASHFGVSETDFRMAFVWLGIKTGLLKFGSITGSGNIPLLQKIPLKKWITPILKYCDVYFNDEGEHWCGQDKAPSERNLLMCKFFRDSQNDSPEKIINFLTKYDWKFDLLQRCLESYNIDRFI
ncbi:MAG: hypothetical protein ACOYU4_00580 [Thermodesulfobacteriota bacterium]